MGFSRTVLIGSIVIAALGLATVATPVLAQANPGVRAGGSLNPDQAYLGGHLETGPLVDRLSFRPNIELGFGNDRTLVALNFEFVYLFPSRRPWSLYAGAGPAINYYVFRDTSDAKGGFNMLIGGQHRDGLFFETKIGALDSPDLKFGIGYSFK